MLSKSLWTEKIHLVIALDILLCIQRANSKPLIIKKRNLTLIMTWQKFNLIILGDGGKYDPYHWFYVCINGKNSYIFFFVCIFILFSYNLRPCFSIVMSMGILSFYVFIVNFMYIYIILEIFFPV